MKLYPDAVEKMPPEVPGPKVKPSWITTFGDAYRVHDLETRRTVTRALFFQKTI